MTDPRKTSPLVLPNFPYRDRFSPAQITEALARKDKLVEVLMDPVGPDGTLINLPVDMLHILGFHLAFAGVDTHTDHRQLIESRVRRDESHMFEVYEWRPRGDFGDDDTRPAEPQSEAAAVAAQMRSQLTPEVRAAVAAILADEYDAAVAATQTTTRERAENVLLEQQMKEGNS